MKGDLLNLLAFLQMTKSGMTDCTVTTSNKATQQPVFLHPTDRLIVAFNSPRWLVELGPVDLFCC